MTEQGTRHSVMATWGYRPPDPARTAQFLRRLDSLPGWHPLHLVPGRRPGGPFPLDLGDEAVARLLENVRDVDDFGHPLPGTGRRVTVWNGIDGDLDLTCRLRVGETDGPLENIVSIEVPAVAAPGTDPAAESLRLVVDLWRPDHAWAGPFGLLLAQGAGGDSAVGRLTYVPHQVPLPLPTSVVAEPFADGTLLRIDATGEELAVEASRLRQVLVDAGVLEA